MCNLEYVENKSSSIAMHKDDDWIWGERLVRFKILFSLCFKKNAQKICLN